MRLVASNVAKCNTTSECPENLGGRKQRQIWIRDAFRKGSLELERKGGADWGKVTWSAWKCAEQS